MVSKTPKGKWIVPIFVSVDNIDDVNKFKKFVRDNAIKKFAHETIEGAMKSFLARKRKQIEILKTQLEHAELAYSIAGGKLPVVVRKYSYNDLYY